jgi:hypothetical protein
MGWGTLSSIALNLPFPSVRKCRLLFDYYGGVPYGRLLPTNGEKADLAMSLACENVRWMERTNKMQVPVKAGCCAEQEQARGAKRT